MVNPCLLLFIIFWFTGWINYGYIKPINFYIKNVKKYDLSSLFKLLSKMIKLLFIWPKTIDFENDFIPTKKNKHK